MIVCVYVGEMTGVSEYCVCSTVEYLLAPDK